MKITDIDFTSIRLIKTSWFTGIGVRYTFNGWLYNVRPGEAIRIVSKDKKNVFFVGTSEYYKIKQIISNELN